MIGISAHSIAHGAETNQSEEKQKLMSLYKKVETVTTIPWYVLASIDQYERNVRHSRKDIPKAEGLIEIYIKPEVWAGPLNPSKEDMNPTSIGLFGGIGEDGNGDNKADRKMMKMSFIPLPIIYNRMGLISKT